MITEMTPCCLNCRFWDAEAIDTQHLVKLRTNFQSDDDDVDASCRRFPRSVPNGNKTLHPKTCCWDWCGEFQQRAELTVEPGVRPPKVSFVTPTGRVIYQIVLPPRRGGHTICEIDENGIVRPVGLEGMPGVPGPLLVTIHH